MQKHERARPSVTKLIVGDRHIHGLKQMTFSYSDQGRTLEKIKPPKTFI